MRHDALDEAPLDRPPNEVAACHVAVVGLKVAGLCEAQSERSLLLKRVLRQNRPVLQDHDVLREHVIEHVALQEWRAP